MKIIAIIFGSTSITMKYRLLFSTIKFLSMSLLVCLLTPTVHSQAVRIKEIKCKPSPQSYNTGDTTIIYPVIVTHNPAVSKLMNDAIKSEVLPTLDDSETVRNALKEFIEDGLTTISYDITFNRNGILCLYVYVEEGRGQIIRVWGSLI